MLTCSKCEAEPDFIRKPVIDNVYITADKQATCRECGSTFSFHFGQVPSERSLKELIYDECDHKLSTIKNLKDRFIGEGYQVYYNMMIYLKYGEMEPNNGIPIVLTLWQPFASLLAAGIKKIETRPRKVSYRGTVLIHAAKNPKDDFRHIKKQYGDMEFPNGAIVGAMELYFCAKIIHPDSAKTYKTEIEAGFLMIPPAEPELSLGDYKPNNYAWLGYNHRLLEEPIPYTNGQGYGLRLREDIKYSDLKFKV